MSTTKSLLDRPIVLHSSHREIVLDSDSDLSRSTPLTMPSTPGAGIILRIGIHPRLQSVVYDLYIESPSLSSPGQGEFFDLSTNMERRVQSEQLRIAARCREIASAAIEQAERLEALASSGDKQVDDFDLAHWASASKNGAVADDSNANGGVDSLTGLPATKTTRGVVRGSSHASVRLDRLSSLLSPKAKDVG